jgi:hypothetical protein
VTYEEVKLTDISEDHITIQMSPTKNCDITYLIKMVNNNASSFSINRQELEPVTFKNLTGGVKYNFSVTARAGNFTSAIYNFSSFTRKSYFK